MRAPRERTPTEQIMIIMVEMFDVRRRLVGETREQINLMLKIIDCLRVELEWRRGGQFFYLLKMIVFLFDRL